MSWIRRVASLLLLLVLSPGTSEALENIEHLIGSGHSAHATGTSDQHDRDREHGCGGTLHLCDCCAVISAVLSRPRQIGASGACTIVPVIAPSRQLDIDPRPLERPPRT